MTNQPIFVVGSVDDQMFASLAKALQERDPMQPITIILNSDGGEVIQALGIYELLKSRPAPVTIHAIGACMSAAIVILQAAEHRYATPDCSLMVHFGEETNTSGSEASHNAELNKRMKRIIQERTKRSSKTVNKWFAADTYFTSEKAKKSNLIDEVLNVI